MTDVIDQQSNLTDDDERARIFRAAADWEVAEANRDLGTSRLQRERLTAAIDRLQRGRAFQADPLGLHGTCEEDGTAIRLILRPGDRVYACCTGEPMHCVPFGPASS
jgi:hypothetical protein